jgi:hypothetical protein
MRIWNALKCSTSAEECVCVCVCVCVYIIKDPMYDGFLGPWNFIEMWVINMSYQYVLNVWL